IVVGSLIVLAMVTLALEWVSVRRQQEPFAALRSRPVSIALVAMIVLLAPGKNNAFIYFAF
ncbi:MAG: hypothetical protein N3G20_01665, partial [Verrucomicrobiae bacterium]|nr:hypothetical protein [Verrucomicrobiae bacterium]